MKYIAILLSIAFLTVSCSSNAQDITGDWTGSVEGENIKLLINFHISKTDNHYSTTIDFLSQNAMGFKTTSTTFINNKLIVTLEGQQIVFKGNLKEDIITGTYTQRTNNLSFNLKRLTLEDMGRPQDPKKPYPYISEEVSFVNIKANTIKFGGTLSLPKGIKNPPVAILITGTGAQNRNEEAFNHRPFLVLSDYLTRHGIAVLRYDDRGVGESEGTLRGTNSEDLAIDVEAAVNYLKTRTDINTDKIGLIGHSEGGFIAPIVASKDKHIAFVVSLAGPIADGLTTSLSQTRLLFEQRNMSTEEIEFNLGLQKRAILIAKNENDITKIATLVKEDLELFREQNLNNPYIGTLTDNEIENYTRRASSPKNAYIFKTNPKQFWLQVKCPILAINGNKDSQVISKLNLPVLKEVAKTGKNKDITIIELENLNHFFQNVPEGSGDRDYGLIDETFSPKALKVVKDWVIAKTK